MQLVEIKMEGTFQQNEAGQLKFIDMKLNVEADGGPLEYQKNFNWLKKTMNQFKKGTEVTNVKEIQTKG